MIQAVIHAVGILELCVVIVGLRRGGVGLIARVAAARKLLRNIYCMLSRGEDYRFVRRGRTLDKIQRFERIAELK